VRGFAQVVKTLCRFGYRRGFIADDLAVDLEIPKVPQRIISTFTDDQLAALLAAPDMRRWIGVRDRAILLTMLDTLARASELATPTASSVDLAQRVTKVMGKGGRERQLPFARSRPERCTATAPPWRTCVPTTRSSSPVGEGPRPPVPQGGRRQLREEGEHHRRALLPSHLAPDPRSYQADEPPIACVLGAGCAGRAHP
jgi:hypothetical protein